MTAAVAPGNFANALEKHPACRSIISAGDCMASDLHITLTAEQSEAMEAAIAAGEYTSHEQIVQSTLDDWKWQREWLKPDHVSRLQELWRQGKESGDSQPLDLEGLLADARIRAGLSSGKAA
jgi:Arc/MetJ-type ribon-helix-helix transcriptional regulator